MALTLRRFLTVSGLTLCSRLTGFLALPVVAIAMGLSPLADGYAIATLLPFIVYELAVGGILGALAMPILAAQREQTDREAYARSVAALVSTITPILLLLAIAGFLVAPWLVALLADAHANPAALEPATQIVRWLIWQIPLLALGALAGVALNLEGKFALVAGAPMAANIGTVVGVGLSLLVPDSMRAHALGAGTLAGTIVMSWLQARAADRLFARERVNSWRDAWTHPIVRRLLWAAGAPLAIVIVQQLALATRAGLAADTPGGFAAMQLAFRFFQLPYGLLAVSLFTLTMPDLARAVARADRATAAAMVGRAVRWTTAGMGLVAILYALAAPTLMRVLLGWGAMSPDDAALVGQLLFFYALAVAPFALTMLILRIGYAYHDPWTVAAFQAVIALVQIPLAHSLYGWAGLHGLAATALCSYALGSLIGLGLLWKWTRLPTVTTNTAAEPKLAATLA